MFNKDNTVCMFRFEVLNYMASSSSGSNSEEKGKAGGGAMGGEVPRFTVTLLDAVRTAPR